MVAEKKPAACDGQASKDGCKSIIAEVPKEANYVRFTLACLRSDYPLEEIPSADARRIFQRCLAWHIVATKIEPRFFSDLIDDVSAIDALAAEVATTYGKQRALFPMSLFRSAMNDWSYRKFAILAAVYASIGQCDYRVVTRDKITAGSIGFSNQKEREAFGSTFEPITVNKLRTTLDQLVTSRLITRAEYTGRTTAYGRVKPEGNLADKIAKRQGEKNKPFSPSFWNKVHLELEKQNTSEASAVRPQESSEQKYDRKAKESLERQAAADARNLRLYPPKPSQNTAAAESLSKPPTPIPTPEETEAKRQEVLRAIGQK